MTKEHKEKNERGDSYRRKIGMEQRGA